MRNKYTPGPLTVVEGSVGLFPSGGSVARVIVKRSPAGSRCVAMVFGPDDNPSMTGNNDQREANAHLYASAPELAAVSENLIATFGDLSPEDIIGTIAEDPSTLTSIIAAARAALKKDGSL